MERRNRTNRDRPSRPVCPSPTLLAVMLLLTVVPGGAAYAVFESDVTLRTALRDCQGRDDPCEIAFRAATTIVARTRATETVASPIAIVEGSSGVPAESAASIAPDASAPIRGACPVRVALLNLPPPAA